MVDKDTLWDMNMHQYSGLDDCPKCMKGTMMNPPIPSRTFVVSRPGAVIHTDVVIMNVPLTREAGVFLASVGEASGHLKFFRMNSTGKAAQLLKRRAGCVE